MARAHKLYVVTDGDGCIQAGFTVKHELITWYQKSKAPIYWNVAVIRDGTNEVEYLGEFGEIRWFDDLHQTEEE